MTDIHLEGMVIAITGHRPSKLGGDYSLTSESTGKIRRHLMSIIVCRKPDYMISGMALGIDTLWAQLAVINSIPLIAAIPFKNQDKKWSQTSREVYNQLLSNAYEVVNVSGKDHYHAEYMQLRNEWMVDHCTRLIAVFDGSPGGTANCLKYAQSKMKPEDITIINPTLL